MEKRKWLVVKAGIVLIAILVVIWVHWTLLLGILQNWSETKALESKVREALSWHQITQRLERENNFMQAQLTAFEEVAKDEVLSGIIDFIQSKGMESGVRFAYLKPHKPQKIAHYQELLFEIGLKGIFHNLGKFLWALESSETVIRVQSLEVSTKDMISKELNISLKISVLFITEAA